MRGLVRIKSQGSQTRRTRSKKEKREGGGWKAGAPEGENKGSTDILPVGDTQFRLEVPLPALCEEAATAKGATALEEEPGGSPFKRRRATSWDEDTGSEYQ